MLKVTLITEIVRREERSKMNSEVINDNTMNEVNLDFQNEIIL